MTDASGLRRNLWAPAVLALAVLLSAFVAAGCGSDSDGDKGGATQAATKKNSASTKSEPMVLPTGAVKCGATEYGDDPCLVPGTPPEGKPVKLAFFGLSGVDYTVKVQEGVKQAAAKYNASVDVFLNAFDPAKEVRQLQDAIAKNTYDGFIIEPVNPAALKPLMKQLVAKKLPFSTWVLTNGTDDTTAKLQFDGQTLQTTRPPAAQADDLAAGTKEACEGKDPCNVAYIRGLPVLAFDNAMVKQFKSKMANEPNIKIVQTIVGEYTTAGARKAMQDVLSAHPDVDVVATHSDGMTLGAEQAVKAAGKKGVQYTSMGGGSYSIKAIKEGRWFSSALVLPVNEGIFNATAIIAAARGAKFAAGIATIDTRGSLPSNLTKNNMSEWADFKGQYLGI